MNDIILKAKARLVDEEAREHLSMLQTKVDTLNERTKQHTRDIQELRRMLRSVERD